MAFFSDGNNEYFSLNLNPTGKNPSYVFILNKNQIYLSRIVTRPLLIISIMIFAIIISFLFMESVGISRYIMSEDGQLLLLLSLCGGGTMIALSEVAFFMWIRFGNRSLLSEDERVRLKNIVILKKKSWMGYLVFLMNMTVVFIALPALPGGLEGFMGDTSNRGATHTLFLVQLIAAALAIAIFLIVKIIKIRFKM
jgi:hypothetical protein